jgi:hypothetical protein
VAKPWSPASSSSGLRVGWTPRELVSLRGTRGPSLQGSPGQTYVRAIQIARSVPVRFNLRSRHSRASTRFGMKVHRLRLFAVSCFGTDAPHVEATWIDPGSSRATVPRAAEIGSRSSLSRSSEWRCDRTEDMTTFGRVFLEVFRLLSRAANCHSCKKRKF